MADLDQDKIARTDWHALSRDKAISALKSDRDGLDDDEVRQRLQRFGKNRMPEENKPGLLRIFCDSSRIR